MSTIGLITDTTANISFEEARQYGIELLPLQIIIDGEQSLRDMKEIDAQEVLRLLASHHLTTSLPLAGDLIQILDRMVEEGKKEVLCFPLSRGVSGSYGLYRQILPLYKEKLAIHLVDGKTATLGQRYPMLKAGKMIQEGFSFAEIVEEVERLSVENLHLFTVENLDALHRSGRISRTVKLLGHLMEARPIIGFDDEGKLSVKEKVRGNRRAIHTLAGRMKEFVGTRRAESATVVHAGSSTLALELSQKLEEELHIPVPLLEISSILTIHTGETIVGCGVFLEKE